MKNYLFLAIQLLATLAYSQKYYVNEDFNNSTLPSGWTSNAVSGTQVWSFGIDGSAIESGINNLDSSALAYFDDDALGRLAPYSTAQLLTPIFDNSTNPYTYLTFDYNFRERGWGSIPDSFFVDVYNGNQWRRVFSLGYHDCGAYMSSNCNNNFPSAFIDISTYADTNCQVRFTYHDGDNLAYYVGIDNVQIWSPFANNMSTIKIINPKNSCDLSISDSIQVLITNEGHLAQQHFDIAFELNGNPAVIETVIDTIIYQDSLIYTFTNTGDFSKVGLHDLKVYTLLPNDSISTNDTISSQITNDSVYQVPYFNDFENTNNGWTSRGINSSWVWGTPAGNIIDTAYSGQNAWATNLSGNYNNGESSYLTSPCFDFSNETVDPVINYQLNYLTQSFYDSLWLEYSTDFGKNWHVFSNQQFWNGNSSGWINTSMILNHLSGEPQVKLRFVFKSNSSITNEGVCIDDISLTKQQEKDLSINSIINPSTNIACSFGSNERIILDLRNYGYNSIDTFKVFYQIDSLPIDSEIVITPIDSHSIYIHTSQLVFDLSQAKSYTLKTWTQVAGDTNYLNDTLTKVLNNTNTNSLLSTPYNESFDSFYIYGGASQNGWAVNPIPAGIYSFGWNLNRGQTPTNYTGPAFDHTQGSSGIGNYIYLQSNNNGSDATLTSPCIQATTSSGFRLSFWYHRYSYYQNIPPLYIDYYDGSKWVIHDSIADHPQTSENSPWTYYETYIPLSNINTRIQFRGSSTSSLNNMAIDDFNISPSNVHITNQSPTTGCFQGNKLPVSVVIKNRSLINIPADSLHLSYTINDSLIYTDTLKQSLNADSLINYTFKDSIDITQWSSKFEVGISVFYVDSIKIPYSKDSFTFHNTKLISDLSEDFESYNLNNYDSKIWNFKYDWEFINDTINNNMKFPMTNKTPNGNMFFYNWLGTGTVNPYYETTIESKCIDVSQADSLYLSFWYNLTRSCRIIIYSHDNGNNIQNIDTALVSYNNDKWEKLVFNLSPYLNNNSIQIGMKLSSTNQSQIGIDDIQLISTPRTHNLRTTNLEVSHNCDYSNSEVKLTIENNGLDSISATNFNVYYQIDNNAIVPDSFTTSMSVASEYTHQFNIPANFTSSNQSYSIKAWLEKVEDFIKTDDSLKINFFTHFQNDSLFEDFENFTDVTCNSNYLDIFKNGWYSPNNTWGIQDGDSCALQFGPRYDHTYGHGNFIYIEPYNRFNQNKIATLLSPCVDISLMNKPVLNYWFYATGYTIDTVWVEVFANGVWHKVDTIIGQQHSSNSMPWLNRSVSLTNYKSSSFVQLRFRMKILGLWTKFALDDISIVDSLTTSLNYLSSDVENYHLYPNPSQGQFTLEVDQIYLGETYQIRELSGKLVQEGRINRNSMSIQLNDKAKGIYFLSIPNMNVQEKVVVY